MQAYESDQNCGSFTSYRYTIARHLIHTIDLTIAQVQRHDSTVANLFMQIDDRKRDHIHQMDCGKKN